MVSDSRHIGEQIDRPAAEVYAYASEPANLPHWAPGLGDRVEKLDGQWFVQSPMGLVGFAFVPANDYGVLDHEVRLPTGETVYNPMRVIPDGDRCEVVFTLRRSPGMSDEDFARDAEAVATDLATLKHVMEGADGVGQRLGDQLLDGHLSGAELVATELVGPELTAPEPFQP